MSRDRQADAVEVFTRLFGPRNTSAPDPDPEFGSILRALIFGDVFATGELSDRTRELITVTCLATQQALPQLRAHAGAALNAGVTPIELREAMYQLAPFLGFPRTLNAVGVVNEVFQARGVELPLPEQGDVTDDERFARGHELQQRLYGTEIADDLASLPAGFAERVPAFLTEFLFGDIYTRGGLDLATRELLGLCTLATLGLSPQLAPHVRGAMAAGNDVETILAALVQAFPYIGYPAALNAIRAVAQAANTGS